MTHDEGACYAPTDIYKASIFLTHWGRMDARHESNTAFTPDNYTQVRAWAGATGAAAAAKTVTPP